MNYNDYDPIANLYDIYVPAKFDIHFFLNETKKVSGEVLELMSGTGRVSIPLLEAGVRLTCVDLSAALNALFRKKISEKGLQADIFQMDVCKLDLPKKFALAIIPFHSFAHILTVGQQREALRRIHSHLLPGGKLICTLGNPAVRRKAVDGQLRLFRKYSLPEQSGTLELWTVENFSPEDPQIVEAMQFFEEYSTGGEFRSKRLLELHFRLSTREEFETLAQEAGFSVQSFYGDYEYAPFEPDQSPFMIWILRR